MDDLLDRFWKSCLFLWIGLHGIGYGMYVTGGNHPWNPVWLLVSNLVSFEIFLGRILIGAVIVGICIGGIYLLAQIVLYIQEKFAPRNKRDEGSVDEIDVPSPTTPSTVKSQTIFQEEAQPIPIILTVRSESPKPNAVDVRERAISQIMGGN